MADDLRSAGRALTGPAVGAYWRYRLGDYRLICDVQDGVLCILLIEGEPVIKPEVPMSAYCGILKDYDLGDIEPPKVKTGLFGADRWHQARHIRLIFRSESNEPMSRCMQATIPFRSIPTGLDQIRCDKNEF